MQIVPHADLATGRGKRDPLHKSLAANDTWRVNVASAPARRERPQSAPVYRAVKGTPLLGAPGESAKARARPSSAAPRTGGKSPVRRRGPRGYHASPRSLCIERIIPMSDNRLTAVVRARPASS